MKKTMKKWMAVAAATITLAGPISTSVSAQTTFDEAFFTELTQANLSYEAVKVDGSVTVSVTSQGQTAEMGQVKFDIAFNGNPLELSLNGEVLSAFLGGQPLSAQAFYQNSIAYFGAPIGENGEVVWQAIDFSAQEQEIIEAYKQGVAQTTTNPELVAKINAKYVDVTETDTEYIVALKKDINAEELWADVEQLVDFEAIKGQVIEQVETQTGETLGEEERAQIDKMYSKETLDQFLKLNPTIESIYDKETKKLKKTVVEVNVETANFLGEQAADAQANGIPEQVLVRVEVNMADHDVPQTVTVPEAALSAEVKTLEQIQQEAQAAAEAAE